MNTFKFISIFVLALIFASSAFAQGKTDDSNQINKPAELHGKIFRKRVDIDSLKHRILKRESQIKNKPVEQQVELLRQTIVDKDTIINILSDSINFKNKIINSNETELKIFRFFNTEDTSIFKSHFMNFSLQELPSCFRNNYRIIHDIRKLDSLLTYIGRKIDTIESGENVKNLSVKKKQDILKTKIKKDLDKANSLIGDIEEKDKSRLYPDQAKYYRPILIDKFNSFIDKVFTNE